MDICGIIANVSADVIFSTLVTIFIFALGLFCKWRYDIYIENKNLKEKKEFYLATIKSLIDPIRKQAKLFEDLSKQIGGKETKKFYFNEIKELYNKLSLFNNIDDLYKIFVNKDDGENEIKFLQYSNIIDTVGFLIEQREKSQLNHTTFFSNFRRYENEWSDAGFGIVMCYDTYASDFIEKNIDKSKDEFFTRFSFINHKWQKMDTCRNIYIAKENLVNPLFDLCKEFISDKRALKLMDYLKKANYAFSNYTNIKDTYSELFEEISNAYIVQSNKFEEAYNYYTRD